MATRDQRLSTLAFRLTPAVLSPHLKDMKHKELIARITYDPEIFGGKPIIRGHRLAVEHVLDMLAAGQNSATIPSGYPWMEPANIQDRKILVDQRGLTRFIGSNPRLPAIVRTLASHPLLKSRLSP